VKWETVVEPSPNDGAPPGVRRLLVPGGWLYQVESYELLSGARVVTRCWHPPVFVPAGGPP
jgi:hypothetical protein